MNYEIIDNEIVFTVKTEQPGKWAIIDALKQTLAFWKKVRFYRVLKRQSFDSVIVKIERHEYLPEYHSSASTVKNHE